MPKEVALFQKNYNDIIHRTIFTLKTINNLGKVVYLQSNKDFYLTRDEKHHNNKILYLDKNDYYYSVLNILKLLYPNILLDKLYQEFGEVLNDLSVHNSFKESTDQEQTYSQLDVKVKKSSHFQKFKNLYNNKTFIIFSFITITLALPLGFIFKKHTWYSSIFFPQLNLEEKVPEWSGKQYSDTALLQERWSSNFFLNNHKVLGNEIVLDIGSGDGRTTLNIAHLLTHGKIIGIDNSPSMISLAKEKTRFIKNIEFIFIDAVNCKFYENYSNYFDVVTSFVTLHWINDKFTVLKNIFTCLKPGGRAYLTIASKSFDPIQQIADKKIHETEWQANFKYFKDPMYRISLVETVNILSKIGFHILSVQDVRYEDTLDSFAAFAKQISSWLPHYKYLSQKKNNNTGYAEKFLNEIVNDYIKNFHYNKNNIILIDHYIHIIIEKPIEDK